MDAELDVQTVARLWLAVVRLSRQIRQHARSGVTPSQLSALSTLDRHGPMRLADLADHEGIARSTNTRIVRQLEDAGLITREADPADGRCAIASLSDSGHALLRDARGRAQLFLADRISALPDVSAAQIAEAATLIERIAARPTHAIPGGPATAQAADTPDDAPDGTDAAATTAGRGGA